MHSEFIFPKIKKNMLSSIKIQAGKSKNL